MRTSLSHLLVVLVLALAVPIQAFAAISAGLCMDLGHHGAAAAYDHAGHSHAAPHHNDDGTGDKGSNAHCPPCVSCCAVTAIASFPAVFVPEQAASVVIGALPASFLGVPPHRLDRPPLAL